jgi:hypothetical protein
MTDADLPQSGEYSAETRTGKEQSLATPARAGNLTIHQYHLLLGEESGVTSCGGMAASHWNGYD